MTLGRHPIAGSRSGRLGLVILAAILIVALLGPAFAPHGISTPVGAPGSGPISAAPFGTDLLGRDVLSRVLNGGRTVLILSGLATTLTYGLGVSVGLLAGYRGGWVDTVLMRGVDVLLSIPALLFLLVLVTGAGASRAILVVGVSVVLFPGVARLVRTATQETAVRGYIEAAVMRGEPTVHVLAREILPNIVVYIVADAGIRFSAAIILIASLNFLGLGLAPPTADWGLMVSENRQILTGNPYALLMPATLLALLTVGVNLIGDAYGRSFGTSEPA